MGIAVSLLVASCSRTMPIDFTDDVERVCAAYCEQNLACHEPALFESFEDCYDLCFNEIPRLWQDDACGEAVRAKYECVGQTHSCEAYIDSNNVLADNYTCKAEKERSTSACLQ